MRFSVFNLQCGQVSDTFLNRTSTQVVQFATLVRGGWPQLPLTTTQAILTTFHNTTMEILYILDALWLLSS